MKKASTIFEIMRTHLHSQDFLETCKKNIRAFTRERIITHIVIFSFILNLLKKSIPKELIAFKSDCQKLDVTRAAITKARAKLAPHSFISMNDILIKEFYTDNSINTFLDFVVLAVDGSTLTLPIDSPEIFIKFGCATNQTQKKIPMAQISHLYDVTNGITLDAIIAPYKAAERDLAIQHLEKLKMIKENTTQQFIALFDRGYPSLGLIYYLLKNKIDFLMRSNVKFLNVINNVVKLNINDSIVKISLCKATPAAKAEIKKHFPDVDLNEEISFRVVLVKLNTGETEILLTSLCDKKKYKHSVFVDFYSKRWGIETNYSFYKVALKIENFSGKTCTAIEQDFHATILAGNARALLAAETLEELKKNDCLKNRKYEYDINKNVSMEGFKNEFIKLMLDKRIEIRFFCAQIKDLMKKNLIPIRPGRRFLRIRKHPHRKYHMNLR